MRGRAGFWLGVVCGFWFCFGLGFLLGFLFCFVGVFGVFLLFLHLYYGLTPPKSHLINKRKRSFLEIYAIIKQSNFNEIPNPGNH